MEEAVREGHSLSSEEISRYSRQLLLPDIGPAGQERICRASVLIVGCGGLGCPVALYLGGAGVGRLGLVDGDAVELSNLHRQVGHSEEGRGSPKAASLAAAVRRLNSTTRIDVFPDFLSPRNALDIGRDFDVLVDCTDRPSSRYLVNDVAVALGKPLVSGSALRWEGQLTVYHSGEEGPCYRCVFPRPPPPATVGSCSDGGVLGPVVGLVGSLQALETLKLLAGLPSSYAGRLLLFDGRAGETRKVRLRGRRADCAVCSEGGEQRGRLLDDYEAFCGTAQCGLDVLRPEERLSVEELRELLAQPSEERRATLVDVRPRHEFAIAALPGSVNLPLAEVEAGAVPEGEGRLVLVCHRGNDSQTAVLSLRQALPTRDIVDVVGGLDRWATVVQPSFPRY